MDVRNAARRVGSTSSETIPPDGKTKADISRRRVLGSAATIFAERGYAGTTMREIARRAGLQAGSLYYHYKSKEGLIEAVLNLAIQGVSESVRLAIAALPGGTSARVRFNAAVLAHLTSVIEFGDYALASRRVFAQVPPHVRRRHIALRDTYGEVWLHLLERAQNDGELRPHVDVHLARTFTLGALNYAIEWYKPNRKPLKDIADQFCLIIGEGIFRSPGT